MVAEQNTVIVNVDLRRSLFMVDFDFGFVILCGDPSLQTCSAFIGHMSAVVKDLNMLSSKSFHTSRVDAACLLQL